MVGLTLLKLWDPEVSRQFSFIVQITLFMGGGGRHIHQLDSCGLKGARHCVLLGTHGLRLEQLVMAFSHFDLHAFMCMVFPPGFLLFIELSNKATTLRVAAKEPVHALNPKNVVIPEWGHPVSGRIEALREIDIIGVKNSGFY